MSQQTRRSIRQQRQLDAETKRLIVFEIVFFATGVAVYLLGQPFGWFRPGDYFVPAVVTVVWIGIIVIYLAWIAISQGMGWLRAPSWRDVLREFVPASLGVIISGVVIILTVEPELPDLWMNWGAVLLGVLLPAMRPRKR